MFIGVLALQGDFAKHIEAIRSLGVEAREVRKPSDLTDCDGLIIPGGESTTIVRQIDFIGFRQPLIDFAKHHPLFGTCAGMILMSRQIQNSPLKSLELLDIEVERNAFGRQVESFQAHIHLKIESGHDKIFPAFFIRAPRIKAVGPEVTVLGRYQDEPVLVRQGNHLAASFHPELTSNPQIHEYFLDIVTGNVA